MNYYSFFLFLLALNDNQIWAFAGPGAPTQRLLSEAVVTLLSYKMPSPNSTFDFVELKKRQARTHVGVCGFKDGDAKQPRTAAPGFDCRVDTQNALWGFCPQSVIAATDCGLAGGCVDSHDCSRGCGILGTPSITVFTWYATFQWR